MRGHNICFFFEKLEKSCLNDSHFSLLSGALNIGLSGSFVFTRAPKVPFGATQSVFVLHTLYECSYCSYFSMHRSKILLDLYLFEVQL